MDSDELRRDLVRRCAAALSAARHDLRKHGRVSAAGHYRQCRDLARTLYNVGYVASDDRAIRFARAFMLASE